MDNPANRAYGKRRLHSREGGESPVVFGRKQAKERPKWEGCYPTSPKLISHASGHPAVLHSQHLQWMILASLPSWFGRAVWIQSSDDSNVSAVQPAAGRLCSARFSRYFATSGCFGACNGVCVRLGFLGVAGFAPKKTFDRYLERSSTTQSSRRHGLTYARAAEFRIRLRCRKSLWRGMHERSVLPHGDRCSPRRRGR